MRPSRRWNVSGRLTFIDPAVWDAEAKALTGHDTAIGWIDGAIFHLQFVYAGGIRSMISDRSRDREFMDVSAAKFDLRIAENKLVRIENADEVNALGDWELDKQDDPFIDYGGEG